ncbi:putative lipid II flippase FtsW [Candidatus Albibeggiatoa sp. nov. NOAA]|uniref:putative lipid II flippase FtsW n=1 Tax=Candidatus Albibeggiatoa sp. nov. NOAA TaxID=3162724 RepID=UPI0032FF73C1|nr:putative lipid II flippase FtsW [Thiotrichaceae bacterium]
MPNTKQPLSHFTYDIPLIFACFVLLLLGLTMVMSSSIYIAETHFNDSLHYFWRQLAFAGMGISIGLVIILIPMQFWHQTSAILLLFGALSLILVLTPYFGHSVNGSMRWIQVAGFNIQPSELMKLFMILYVSSYLIRRSEEVRESFMGFVKPMAVLILIAGLVLLEPDYGATVVLFVTVLGMLFLAGVPMYQFVWWVIGVSCALGTLIFLAPYRLERLTTFMDPWADPFNSGFQLTQALIAIGRGEIFGVGLGNSVQKLAYLPEAHTDFLFAILAEELGLIGVIFVICLFAFVVLRSFVIAVETERLGLHYAAYTAYGIGLCIGLQASINLGVNMGLLPTKGLTLPLMSYGGSSLVVTCMMLAILLRIDHETQQKRIQADLKAKVR